MVGWLYPVSTKLNLSIYWYVVLCKKKIKKKFCMTNSALEL